MSSGFNIVSRRGSEKTVEEVVIPECSPEKWDDVSSVVCMIQGNNGPIISIRTIGLRGDGKTFAVDYLLSPIWNANKSWEKESKERLDTFLNCECSSSGPCATHKMYGPMWLQSDFDRIKLAESCSVSPAIESYMMSQRASSQVIQTR